MGPVDNNFSNTTQAYSSNSNRTYSKDELGNMARAISGMSIPTGNVTNEDEMKAGSAEETTHLQFSIHDKTGDIIVKVIDDNTGDVIREVPPEQILDMIAAFERIDGVIIDEKR